MENTEQKSVADIIRDSAMYEPEQYGAYNESGNFLLTLRSDTAESIAFRVFGSLRSADNEMRLRRPDMDAVEEYRTQAQQWAYQLKVFVQEFFEFRDLNNLIEKIGSSVINSMDAPIESSPRGMSKAEWRDLEKDERKELLKPYKKLGLGKLVAKELILYGVPMDLVEQYVKAGLDVRDLIRMERQVLLRQLKRDAAQREAIQRLEEEFFQTLFDAPEFGDEPPFDAEVERMVIDRLDKLETRLASPKMVASARIKGWEDTLDEATKVVALWQDQLQLEHERMAREQTEHEAEGYAVQEGGVH